MPGAYTTIPTYTLPARSLGLDNVTGRVQVIEFVSQICTGINWVAPTTGIDNPDQDE